MVAAQVRQLHAQYLQPIEDLFYRKIYQNRRAQAQAQAQALAHSNQQTSIQQTQPISAAAGMSAQLLDSAAKTPAASLTEQQRRVMEDARRQPQATHEAAAPVQQVTPTASTSANASGERAMSAASAAQIAALKANPKLIYQFVKSREEHMRNSLRKRGSSYFGFILTLTIQLSNSAKFRKTTKRDSWLRYA